MILKDHTRASTHIHTPPRYHVETAGVMTAWLMCVLERSWMARMAWSRESDLCFTGLLWQALKPQYLYSMHLLLWAHYIITKERSGRAFLWAKIHRVRRLFLMIMGCNEWLQDIQTILAAYEDHKNTFFFAMNFIHVNALIDIMEQCISITYFIWN